ncbi:MAG: membrane protein insertase YidC [Nitrospirales bacterium]|nr:membrane protein insertase YidC [Nitrospirales bacterium]
MDKRMLAAIVLTFGILIGYQFVYNKVYPTKPPAPVTTSSPAQPSAEVPKSADPVASAVSVPVSAISGEEREIKVETDLYTAVFSTKGATLKSVELKAFKDKGGKPIVLRGDATLPVLSIGSDDRFQLAQVNFSSPQKDLRLGPMAQEGNISFEYSAGGQSVRRSYSFNNKDYGFNLRDEVSGLDSYWVTLGKDFGIYEKDDSIHFGPVVLKDAERAEFKAKDLKDPKSFREGIKWIAQEDKYFCSAIVPKSPVQEARAWAKAGDAFVALKMPAGASTYYVYAGPKEYDNLKALGFGLEHIVDFGFFSILARPLFWFLKILYSVFHNYGVAIIILTILVRIPFLPLIAKGQKSMRKLQDIQPRMAEIREKYKSDPQRMQKEIMELYKTNKVNPMGGCLPMVLQIPVFFALYKVLLISIELRGAPFMFWIQDLSTKDPYYILPVVMGATMVIQQKMTPSTMEPMQQKMMMIMPVVFTFMFLSFPSGLVVYWLVNNLLSIGQQFYMNRKLKAKGA